MRYQYFMRPLVKICGLTRPRDIASAIRYGADFCGFIVEAQSPRRLSLREAAKLSLPVKPIAKTVAVTVSPSVDLALNIAQTMRPDYLQIHGALSRAQAKAIKIQTGLPLIRALSIKTRGDLDAIAQWQAAADYILLDAAAPKGSAQAGGHGMAFDWSLLKNIRSTTPLILAGGLRPDNAKAARATGFTFFDVSSGLEQNPGVKDPDKIAAFMKSIRPER